MSLAVVSGGGTGIGAACAHRLAGLGFSVLLVGRRREVLEQTAQSVRSATAGAVVLCEPADLSRPDEAGRVAERVRSQFAGVHVVVNNAGAPAVKHGSDLREVARAWLDTYAVNTVSAVLLTTALEPMLAAPGGRVIIVGSQSAHTGSASPAYGAAKAALEGYMRTLAARLGPRGITANVVAPGFTENTELTVGRMPESRRRRILSSVALGRPAQPDEIAAAVAFGQSGRGVHHRAGTDRRRRLRALARSGRLGRVSWILVAQLAGAPPERRSGDPGGVRQGGGGANSGAIGDDHPGVPAKTRQRFRWGGETPPVVAWAPIRAAEDLRDTP